MTTTAHIEKTVRVPAAESRAAATGGGKNLGRRLGLRLWTILHAQALLNGTADPERYSPR